MRIPLSLPHELRRLRTEAGLTQRALEQRAELSKHRISHLEAGARTPARHELQRLCEALGVSFDALVEATRWEPSQYGRPGGALEPDLRAAFREAEPFAWTDSLPFAASFGAAFLDFPRTARDRKSVV